AHDPTPAVEVQGSEPVVWLGFDPGTRSLLWASGAALHGVPETGGTPRVLVGAGSPIRTVLPTGAGRYVLCTRDSVLLVDTKAGTVRGAGALTGALPDRAYPGSNGDVLLVTDGTHEHAPSLLR